MICRNTPAARVFSFCVQYAVPFKGDKRRRLNKHIYQLQALGTERYRGSDSKFVSVTAETSCQIEAQIRYQLRKESRWRYTVAA
jgi:hypothetical protein